MSQKIIRATFLTALAAYADSKGYPIAREGVPFEKPTDNEPYLEASLIPADTQVAVLDGSRRRFWGSFQINIWTEDSKGAGLGEQIAEEIAQLFPVFPKTLLPVSVEAPASIKRSMLDSGWRVTPVVIDYRMESEN